MRNNPLTKENKMNTAIKILTGAVLAIAVMVIGTNWYTWSQVK